MSASKPSELPQLFLRALNSGAPESVASLYEPNAVVAPDPAQVVSGRTSIQAMVAGFLSQNPHFDLHETEVVQAGDVALVRSRWTVSQPDSKGGTTSMNIWPTLVARRQSDGTWMVVIDRPLAVG